MSIKWFWNQFTFLCGLLPLRSITIASILHGIFHLKCHSGCFILWAVNNKFLSLEF
jgi:hypothetical protein